VKTGIQSSKNIGISIYFKAGIKKKRYMSLNLKQCEADALKLAPEDRALLAERFIASLDSLEESEVEQLWLKEAERKYKEYRKGKIPARSARDVLRGARSAIN
jgi:hypothetical protein